MVKKKQQDSPWAIDLVRRFGLTAKKVRGKRTAQWLSDETERLGFRISPTVIAKLDSGSRNGVLSVPEMLVIAAALNTAPGLLLYPDLPDGKVDLFPGVERSSAAAIFNLTAEFRTPEVHGREITPIDRMGLITTAALWLRELDDPVSRGAEADRLHEALELTRARERMLNEMADVARAWWRVDGLDAVSAEMTPERQQRLTDMLHALAQILKTRTALDTERRMRQLNLTVDEKSRTFSEGELTKLIMALHVQETGNDG